MQCSAAYDWTEPLEPLSYELIKPVSEKSTAWTQLSQGRFSCYSEFHAISDLQTGFCFYCLAKSVTIYFRSYYPGQKKKKKKNHPEIRGGKNAVPSDDHVISCSISAGQKSWRVADDLALRWSLVTEHDITWWNSVLLTANLGDGFVQGSITVHAAMSHHARLCIHSERLIGDVLVMLFARIEISVTFSSQPAFFFFYIVPFSSKIILQMFMERSGYKHRVPGVLVPVPQYPLYSATITEFGAHQVSSSLQ